MVVDIRKEESGRDEKALMCFIPDCLTDHIASRRMESKSSRKSYLMREVQGKPVGRVQYFLNKILVDLINEGKVKHVKG